MILNTLPFICCSRRAMAQVVSHRSFIAYVRVPSRVGPCEHWDRFLSEFFVSIIPALHTHPSAIDAIYAEKLTSSSNN